MRRSVQYRGVKGVLVRRDGCWTVDNEPEVRMLGALGEDCAEALEHFRALAETLNAGLVDGAGLRRLNSRLSEIAAAEERQLATEWLDPQVMAQVAFASSCITSDPHHNALRWLAWALSARLDGNLVRDLLPGPGWLSMRYAHLVRDRGYDRDVCWVARMPAEFWIRLRYHPVLWLRAAASASDPRTSPAELRQLARSDSEVVLDLVASHPNTPARVLRRLALVPGEKLVPLRVLQNARASRRLLCRLATHPLMHLRVAVAAHPSTPRAVVEALADDDSEYVRAEVASNEHLPSRVVRRLARDCSEHVRCAVALNPAAGEDVVEALLADRIAAVRAAAVHGPGGWLASWPSRVEEDRAVIVRRSLAQQPAVEARILAKLARDPNIDVQMAAATNENTPVGSLELLASASEPRVRSAVASNPSIPSKSLRLLARDDSAYVREAVAWNTSAPPDLLVELLESAPSGMIDRIRVAVAGNPAAPAEMLRSLSTEDDLRIQYRLAENPAAPREVLEGLASHDSCHVRERVAVNVSAPLRVVVALAVDEDRRVRKAAANNPRARRRTGDSGGA